MKRCAHAAALPVRHRRARTLLPSRVAADAPGTRGYVHCSCAALLYPPAFRTAALRPRIAIPHATFTTSSKNTYSRAPHCILCMHYTPLSSRLAVSLASLILPPGCNASALRFYAIAGSYPDSSPFTLLLCLSPLHILYATTAKILPLMPAPPCVLHALHIPLCPSLTWGCSMSFLVPTYNIFSLIERT